MNNLAWVLLLGLFAVGSTYNCDEDAARLCYDNLTHYDEMQFPSRGVGFHQLEDVCKNLNESFDCVDFFISTCHGHPSCNASCEESIFEMKDFGDHSGLLEVKDVLCDYEKEESLAYVKGSKCLNEQMDKFDYCRDIWKRSVKYISKILDKEERKVKACCAATFYKGCITNATLGVCPSDTTTVVDYIFDMLFWRHQENACVNFPVCDRPLIEPISASSPLVNPYSSGWSSMYFVFMLLGVLLINY